MPVIKIRDDVYINNIKFIYDETDEKIVKLFKKEGFNISREQVEDTSAFTTTLKGNNHYIAIRDNQVNWLGTLVHECTHVTARIFRLVGIPLTQKTEEAYTYYMEWLFNACAIPAVKRKNKRKNKRKTK